MKQASLLVILACLAVTSCRTYSEPTTATDNSVAARDRQEILDLIAHYSHTWDGRDASGWSDLFLPQGMWEMYCDGQSTRSLDSKQARLKFAQAQHRAFVSQGIVTRHHQTNTLLRTHADGAIHGETIFSVLWQRAEEPAPKLVHSGVYRDVFVKTRGSWKFQRREVRVDHAQAER